MSYTVFNVNQAVQEAKQKKAKELGKKVEELTPQEIDEALYNMPIRDWDLP